MGEVSNIKHIPDADIVCLEGNGVRPSHKGDGWSVGGVMYTLNGTEVHAVCYSLGGYNSAAWLDGKPDTGCYITETSRTLDSNNCCNPACNQGGGYV